MSDHEKIQLAKQYVDEQLKVIAKLGKSAKPTREKYNEMVTKVAKEIVCK